MSSALDGYSALLGDVKARIQGAQVRAALAANRELLLLYWDIGRLIAARKSREGWGAAVIPRLARDLREDLPGVKGFSESNLKRTVQYVESYPAPMAPSPASATAGEEGAQPVPHWAAEQQGELADGTEGGEP